MSWLSWKSIAISVADSLEWKSLGKNKSAEWEKEAFIFKE